MLGSGRNGNFEKFLSSKNRDLGFDLECFDSRFFSFGRQKGFGVSSNRQTGGGELKKLEVFLGEIQGCQVGDAIAHFTHLGEILDILAKILANKNAIKAQISGFERIFSLVICSKVRFGAKCGQNVDLEDLATLRSRGAPSRQFGKLESSQAFSTSSRAEPSLGKNNSSRAESSRENKQAKSSKPSQAEPTKKIVAFFFAFHLHK